VCCNLNGGGGGEATGDMIPEMTTALSTASAIVTSSTAATVTPSSTAEPFVSTAEPVVSTAEPASTASPTGGDQSSTGEGILLAQTQTIPGLGEVHVYRLFPGATTPVVPGSVPGRPDLITLPGDVTNPGTIPSPSAVPSSDGLVKGVRFETPVAAVPSHTPAAAPAPAHAQAAAPTPAPAPASPPLYSSHIPSGMVAPAIDPTLHLGGGQGFALAGANGELIHPAVSPTPLSPGLVQASYTDGSSMLLQQKEQGSSPGSIPPALLEYIRNLPLPGAAPVQPVQPAAMSPNQMLQYELDVLRKQMQK